ncbi:hypothetical protein A2U01_0031597, partial [Trifolium medium]|nr:hypothetical protein [Trifolium medium]
VYRGRDRGHGRGQVSRDQSTSTEGLVASTYHPYQTGDKMMQMNPQSRMTDPLTLVLFLVHDLTHGKPGQTNNSRYGHLLLLVFCPSSLVQAHGYVIPNTLEW